MSGCDHISVVRMFHRGRVGDSASIDDLAGWVSEAIERHYYGTSSEPEGINYLAAKEGFWERPIPVQGLLARPLADRGDAAGQTKKQSGSNEPFFTMTSKNKHARPRPRAPSYVTSESSTARTTRVRELSTIDRVRIGCAVTS